MEDDDLDIKSLMVFAHVVREKSFSEAAKKLKRPKQSIHRQVKQFEQALSRKLLQKNRRAVVPTPAGLHLFRVAEKIRQESRAGMSFLRLPPPLDSTELRLTAPALFAEAFLGPVVSDLLDRHPKVRLDFVLTNDVLDLLDGKIDVAFRIGAGGLFPKAPGYRTIRIGTASRVMVASRQYLKKNGSPKTVGDLSRHRILQFGGINSLGQTFGKSRRKVRLESVVTAMSPHFILNLVLRGSGVALLPEMICSSHIRTKKLVQALAGDAVWPVPISMVVREDLVSSPVVETLIPLVQGAARVSTWLDTSTVSR